VNQKRFVEILIILHQKSYPTLKYPTFIFENSQAAAHHNSLLLETHHYNLGEIIASYHPSPLSFGSEFWPTSDIFELLQHHPHWPHLHHILENGATFPLQPIEDTLRKRELTSN